MKFGKNLSLVVDISDPEWAPFWINYKQLKKLINDIVSAQGGVKVDQQVASKADEIKNSKCERDFFQCLRYELKKASDFFSQSEQLYKIRQRRVEEGYKMLKETSVANKSIDKNAWKMLLSACMKLFKDILLLENFAIMNYCGFSKILKKHDKSTGYSTRDAFMRNVMSRQNFTHYPYVMECIKKAESLFADIEAMESTVGTALHAEEKLFIEALRGLNYQASKLQEEEKDSPIISADLQPDTITKSSRLFPHGETTSVRSDVMSDLGQAASLASHAAVKVSTVYFSPNIQGALSWMDAISRKPPQTSNPSIPVTSGPPVLNAVPVEHTNVLDSMKRKQIALTDYDLEDAAVTKKLCANNYEIETA